ncbi:MAG: hypothetical protein QXG98_00130 [Candidatus Micrarchaeia archaeon]
MSQIQARVDPKSIACARRALETIVERGCDPKEFNRILEKITRGHKLEDSEEKLLEVFLGAYSACKLVGPEPLAETLIPIDKETEMAVIAKIIKLEESRDRKTDTNEDRLLEEKTARKQLLLSTSLAAIYEQLGGGLFEKVVETTTIAVKVGGGLSRVWGAASRVLHVIAAQTEQTLQSAGNAGGRLTSDAVALVGRRGSALAEAAVRWGSAAVCSAAAMLDAAKDRFGMKDVLYIVPQANGQELPIERALNGGKKRSIDAAVRKTLIELNTKRGKELVESAEYRYFVKKAEEGGEHAEALIDSLARIRRNKELCEIATILIQAMRSFGGREVRERGWEALQRKEVALAA